MRDGVERCQIIDGAVGVATQVERGYQRFQHYCVDSLTQCKLSVLPTNPACPITSDEAAGTEVSEGSERAADIGLCFDLK